MSGWVPMDVDTWADVAPLLPKPWPWSAIMHDLRWWADRERMGAARRPGRPALRERWGVTDYSVRKALKAEDEWGDPSRRKTDSGPTADRQRTDSGPTAPATEKRHNAPESDSGPTADRQRTDSGPPHARRRHPTPTPTPTPVEQQSVENSTPAPAWCRSYFQRQATADKVEHVRAVLAELRQREPQSRELGSLNNAKQLHGLWRSEGCAPLDEWTRDVVLVAKAMRECPHPLFARDVRAEGWESGTDRSRSLATLCVQARWSDRLDVARRWEAGELEGQRVAGRVPRREFDVQAHLRAIEGGKND